MQNANAQLHEGHREVHHRTSHLGDGQIADADLGMLCIKDTNIKWSYYYTSGGTYVVYQFPYNAIPLLRLRIVFAIAINDHELVIELHELGKLANEIHGIALVLFPASEVLVILPKGNKERL